MDGGICAPLDREGNLQSIEAAVAATFLQEE